MKINSITETAQTMVVMIKRSRGNLFYAGPTSEHPKAKDDSDSLGTPIKGRPGFYPVIANFPEDLPNQEITMKVATGELVKLPVVNATCTLAMSEADIRRLNAESANAFMLTVTGRPSLNTSADYDSKIYGSVWIEVAVDAEGDSMINADEPAVSLVPSEDEALAAIRANADRNVAERLVRQEARAAATAAREAGSAQSKLSV